MFTVYFCYADTVMMIVFYTCDVSDADLPLDTASRLFSSGVGVSVLADSVHQMAETRLSVCRDLLILVILIERLSEQVTRPLTDYSSTHCCLSLHWSLIIGL